MSSREEREGPESVEEWEVLAPWSLSPVSQTWNPYDSPSTPNYSGSILQCFTSGAGPPWRTLGPGDLTVRGGRKHRDWLFTPLLQREGPSLQVPHKLLYRQGKRVGVRRSNPFRPRRGVDLRAGTRRLSSRRDAGPSKVDGPLPEPQSRVATRNSGRG